MTFATARSVVKILSCLLSPKNDAGTLELIWHKSSAFAPLTRACHQNTVRQSTCLRTVCILALRQVITPPGLSVYVTSDFQPGSPMNSTVVGAVVRIDNLEAEKWGVAIHIVSSSSLTAN